MTESTDTPARKKRSGGLSSMLIADLKTMASGLGIKGASSMKKAQLVEAIKVAQADRAAEPAPAAPAPEKPIEPARTAERPVGAETEQGAGPTPETRAGSEESAGASRGSRQRRRGQNRGQEQPPQNGRNSDGSPEQADQAPSGPVQDAPDQSQPGQGGQRQKQAQGRGSDQHAQGQPKQSQQNQKQNQGQQNQKQNQGQGPDQQNQDDDGEGGGRRNRRRRGRDRNRQRNEPDTTILEDDVLVPAAGILDVLDNYAFVRTTGYLPGSEDVYVALSMVKKLGLRPGDAVVGQVRHPREGERREKFNPMVRIDNVNGQDPETARNRDVFTDLTPIHPEDRLRLATSAGGSPVGRLLDLAAPIGKGQRELLLAPPKAGRTRVLQQVAASISENNPECHLMVVLVDERPEEVTEYRRSVKGEVIASTFDRAPSDHTQVAELAIDRAKRLVELGHDVVVLLDGIARLGRAYSLLGQGGGRLAGGVDPAAIHPTKRFFGAARNIEDGGSLTIVATASDGSGSPADQLITDEIRDTANAEVRLSRELAEHRLFPAVDLVGSATRREDMLLDEAEQEGLAALRRTLTAQEPLEGHRWLLGRVQATPDNAALLAGLRRG